MAVPTYQELMLPLLQVLNEQGALHRHECARLVGEKIGLNEEDAAARLPSGKSTYLGNRTGWAGWYMTQAGLAKRPRRGCFDITDEGRRLLSTNPSKIDNHLLSQYPSFVERVKEGKGRKNRSTNEATDEEGSEPDSDTPEEQIDRAVRQLDDTLASDLKDQMAVMDPFGFEQLVVDLLFAMGYGGSREEARVTKKSNDEGIDGIINEDRLGLDVIYVQAKRWQAPVGRKEIQSFVGALAGQQANKGVFITTSGFSQNAIGYARSVTQKVILIDGDRLADLMIEHSIGVSTSRVVEIKRIDSDYFDVG